MRAKEYSIPSSVLLQEIDNELLIFNSETGQFYSVNDTGAVIWESIIEHDNLGDVLDDISEVFDVDRDILINDLLKFVLPLYEQGLLILAKQK
ncbi:PqqD family protein [Sulfuricurvum sp.]|uniref:PqqD family protein n=1 Tax=Sulfuricurvum sp. TaxID=2025608 RepID=UPI0026215B90|nr:PqqD family protein [Sulfuricurvum sp.]MDD2837509.1 PqqD family protein [Sulfuricurvum sp.]MDD3595642.1 PqqD family protein [Sulfuricurvum sp.]MDD4883765.1 PqqD family protein [Sulfuricurvum sp.]